MPVTVKLTLFQCLNCTELLIRRAVQPSWSVSSASCGFTAITTGASIWFSVSPASANGPPWHWSSACRNWDASTAGTQQRWPDWRRSTTTAKIIGDNGTSRVAGSAFRWSKALTDLYERLVGKGKSHKVAPVACARKLLLTRRITT